MARPRKPEDPQRWPVPCDRCGRHYEVVANWPNESVCGYCYQAAKRITGICACGHQGVLPGIIDNQPACRRCSGVTLNVDCVSCGEEAELYSGGRCQRCVLAATARHLLTNPDTGTIAPALQIIVDALHGMARPNSGLTWIRQAHVQTALRDLARQPTLTHEVLDGLPPGRTTDYLRSLLVEHGALPSRDERLARFQAWAATKLDRITTDDHRKVITRFVRWGLEKRLLSMSPVTDSAFLRAKQSLTVTIDFCNWLAAEHDTAFDRLTQAHIDLWQSTGPTTREHIARFIRWAIKSKLLPSDLEVTPHRRGTSAADADHRAERSHRNGGTPAAPAPPRPACRHPGHRVRPAHGGRGSAHVGSRYNHRRDHHHHARGHSDRPTTTARRATENTRSQRLQQPDRRTSELPVGISRLSARHASHADASSQPSASYSGSAGSPPRHAQRVDPNHPDRDIGRNARVQPSNIGASCSSICVDILAVRCCPSGMSIQIVYSTLSVTESRPRRCRGHSLISWHCVTVYQEIPYAVSEALNEVKLLPPLVTPVSPSIAQRVSAGNTAIFTAPAAFLC